MCKSYFTFVRHKFTLHLLQFILFCLVLHKAQRNLVGLGTGQWACLQGEEVFEVLVLELLVEYPILVCQSSFFPSPQLYKKFFQCTFGTPIGCIFLFQRLHVAMVQEPPVNHCHIQDPVYNSQISAMTPDTYSVHKAMSMPNKSTPPVLAL